MRMGYIGYAIRNSFRSLTAYRTFTVVSILSSAFGLMIQIAIWKALYNGQNILQAGTKQVSLADMIQYAVLSTFLSILINNNVAANIEQRITSGQVSIDFIRPVGFGVQITCAEAAGTIFQFLFSFLPMAAISLVLVGKSVLEIKNGGVLLIVTANSMLLYYLINYMIGLLSFWFLTVWPLRQILDGVIKLLSGAVIPLWFLPGGIYKAATVLPFRLIYYLPVSIGLGKADRSEILGGLLFQIVWIAAFALICMGLWKKGNGKLTVQGG
ncbi:MAG: ABC-2 family transporter protein [Lachnospiraceae bacterium]|nr:ABC-2 family transporter protein [Lachnospiraceae bacterium]MBP5221683.1 ABC-2 family transporter protein [Lachnospiraceae bacterium]